MEVVIEIPAGSFSKTAERDGKMVLEFRSPLPSLFNYGYAVDTRADDGMPQDVVVLGPRLSRGTRVQAQAVAVARFVDRGARDDKIIASPTGRAPSMLEKAALTVFFTVYAAYKRLRYRSSHCQFEGLRNL